MRELTFKSRKHSVVTLSDKKVYKIPSEYTVEEVERLLELQEEQKKLEGNEIIESIKDLQVESFYKNIFNQLEIIFQHYQPKVTVQYLKKIITHSEALEMVGFFNKYRNLILNQPESTNEVESKKKSKVENNDLRDLRRVITFMVINGFSLFEVRKLYIDELYYFYTEMFYSLEKMGRVNEGTYDNIISNSTSNSDENTVKELKRQFFKSIADKK